MIPKIIFGGNHKDDRGEITFNNDFNPSQVKRFYSIENIDTSFIRRWQGHRIEQRWFTAISGKFEIQLILVDDWDTPSVQLEKITFELGNNSFDILHIPPGYISSIQSLTDNSKLLVMADHALNEVKDEYRFPVDYFKK